jgi:hypothetical protein
MHHAGTRCPPIAHSPRIRPVPPPKQLIDRFASKWAWQATPPIQPTSPSPLRGPLAGNDLRASPVLKRSLDQLWRRQRGRSCCATDADRISDRRSKLQRPQGICRIRATGRAHSYVQSVGTRLCCGKARSRGWARPLKTHKCPAWRDVCIIRNDELNLMTDGVNRGIQCEAPERVLERLGRLESLI